VKKFLFTTGLFALGLLFGQSAQAVYTQDFEDFNLGSLNNQGDWVASSTFQVNLVSGSPSLGYQSATVIDNGFSYAWVSTTQATDTIQVFWVKADQVDASLDIIFSNRANFFWSSYTEYSIITFTSSGLIQQNTANYPTGALETLQSYLADTWYRVKVKWTYAVPDYATLSVSINDGTWSTSTDTYDPVYINVINFGAFDSGTNGKFYLDGFYGDSSVDPVYIIPQLPVQGSTLVSNSVHFKGKYSGDSLNVYAAYTDPGTATTSSLWEKVYTSNPTDPWSTTTYDFYLDMDNNPYWIMYYIHTALGGERYYFSDFIINNPVALNTCIYGEEADFCPVYPVDCEFNVVATTVSGLEFTPTGYFVNPQGSDITYDHEYILFYRDDQWTTTTSLGGTVAPNNISSYMPDVVLPVGQYRIEYKAEGHDQAGNYKLLMYNCQGTGIGYEAPTGAIDWYGITTDPCASSYCDTASTTLWSTEGLLCGIKNFGLSMVCPDPNMLVPIVSMGKDIQNRFPSNYMRAISNAFSQDTNISTNTSATNTSFVFAYSGIDKFGQISFLQFLRTGLSYILLFACAIWCIRYAATEFFT
jgi:hypothetical protein